jgi:hypothetical protein
MKKLLIVSLFTIFAAASSAFAQYEDKGKLNAWTAVPVARHNKNSKALPYLREIRTAKNKGFDRLVFEFTGDIPRYYIEFVKPPIFGTADEEVKVSGKYFMTVTLSGLPFPEPGEEELGEVKFLDNKPNLPVLQEILGIEWFEGDRPFAIGLKAKKLYRVQQLKNPTRLVIDFKH